jgi:hypothetical protein
MFKIYDKGVALGENRENHPLNEIPVFSTKDPHPDCGHGLLGIEQGAIMCVCGLRFLDLPEITARRQFNKHATSMCQDDELVYCLWCVASATPRA